MSYPREERKEHPSPPTSVMWILEVERIEFSIPLCPFSTLGMIGSEYSYVSELMPCDPESGHFYEEGPIFAIAPRAMSPERGARRL